MLQIPQRMSRWRRGLPVLSLLVVCASLSATAPAGGRTGLLKVSENKRFLVHEDGMPFFYLGDTAWELFHRLNREEADRYLANRAAKGFTVIQAVAIAEVDGQRDRNPYGHLPLIDQDPARPAVKDGPDNDYWDHIDYIVAKANSLGLFIGFLPTWGRYWHDKVKDDKPLFTVENAETYGRWVGQRYKDASNIIWILGGDRTIDNDQQKEIIRAMARGLRQGDGGAHLMTFHPRGGSGSSKDFHNDDWLDFNMRQNGHNAKFNEGYQNTRADYDLTPIKPVLDGEPMYEDHPVSFRAKDLGHSISSDIRRPLYWDLFTGACGHTYGHHSVWQMWQPGRDPINNPLMPWFEAIDQPGAGQMQYGRWLMESRPFLSRVPDDSIVVVHRSDSSVSAQKRDAIVETKLTHVAYTRDTSGKAVLYVNGKVVESGNVVGDLSNWKDDLRLALGNELTEDRPWLGELHRVALYARALDSRAVARSAEGGRNQGPDEPVVLYEFREGTGPIAKDTSGTGTPLNLRVKDASTVRWLSGGGLQIVGSALIASSEPATKLIEAVKRSKAITMEAWIKPENTVQAGPARIVTISRDSGVRNVTLGQKAGAYEVRLRTTATSANGEPALSSPGDDTPAGPLLPTAVPGAGRYRFVGTRDADGSYAMVYAPIGRAFKVRMDVVKGEKVRAWWYNPRNGQADAIGEFPNAGERQFLPPDKGEMLDWVLVLDDASRDFPPPGARARTTLGVEGTRFTLNGKSAFLLGISYYGGLGASQDSIRRDLDDVQRYGFNWLRVWATWGLGDADVSAVDAQGLAREPFLGRLKWLVGECDRRGLVVDVTLTRDAGGRLPDFAAHQRAVTTLVEALKTHRNWYLDLGNERDVRDGRYVSISEVKALRDQVRRIDPQRLVTASFGGHDLSEEDVRESLATAGLDFLCPHRPRHAGSSQETEGRTRELLALMKKIGRAAPVHYQEPFRRGYTEWEPAAADFVADLRGAVVGGAAGWCFHNGTQRSASDQEPRRSFDLSARRLFDQLDGEEAAFVAQASRMMNE